MTELSDWSAMIERQGKESQRKDDEFLERLQAETPEAIKSLPTQTNEWLVAQLMEARGSHDPRVTIEYARFKDHVKIEVLKRMKEQ